MVNQMTPTPLFEWDADVPGNAYVYDGHKTWYLTGIKDISIEEPNLQPVSDNGLVTFNLTFNYDFTDNGKPNDNAPDSVRPDLHTGGEG